MDASTWFMGFHMIQLGLVGLVAVSVFVLADQFHRASAWQTCLGMGVFLVYFSAYDTLAGIGTGLAMQSARDLPTSQQEALFDIVQDWPALEPWVFWLSHPRHVRVGTRPGLPGGRRSSRARTAFGVAVHRAGGLLLPAGTSRAVRHDRVRQPVHRRPHPRTAGLTRPGPRRSPTGRDRPSPSERGTCVPGTEVGRWLAAGEPGGEWFCSASRPSTCSSASCIPRPTPSWATRPTYFIGLHIAQLFLIMGLGYVLWLLVEGVTNRAATLARALIIPFVVVYTALDAILGIAWGIAAETANDLPAADQPGAGRLIDELISGDPDPRGLILYWGAGLLWLAVALAVVAALRDTAPLGALVSMALGAAVFTLGHAPPMGPVGMGLFLLGIAWAEFRPRPAERLSAAAGT